MIRTNLAFFMLLLIFSFPIRAMDDDLYPGDFADIPPSFLHSTTKKLELARLNLGFCPLGTTNPQQQAPAALQNDQVQSELQYEVLL